MNNDFYTFMRESRFAKALVLLLMLASAYFAILIVNAVKEYKYIGGGVPVTNVVSVAGMGEVFAVPDIATFTFSVTEEKASAGEAQEASAKKINDILGYLKENGVEEKDVKTVGYSVFPRYEYETEMCGPYGCGSGERVLKGFNASQTITVKVRDTKKAGDLLAGIGSRGATDVSGLDFTIDEPEELQKEARAKAIADARAKAKELAGDLDVRLVRVVNFSENSGGYPQPMYAMDAYGKGGGMMESAPSIPTGENKIVSNVTITYEIR